MTIAEQLRAMGAAEAREETLKEGREEGLEEKSEEIAINLLNEGMNPHFVARNTGLELADVLKLKTKLEED